jgi:alpha,alpha-trehalose phosphorylase
MIQHPGFSVEPWSVRATCLDLDVLAQIESVFTLSNGHIGWRANLDEGEPNGLPGSYLNGVWEQHPLPYAEAGYGYPEAGQTVINVTNGKLIRLLVDDAPFDVRYGQLHTHEQELDLRAGVLRRRIEWTSRAGRMIRVTSQRLVSLTQRAVAAVAYEVEVLNGPASVVVQSELVANEQLPPPSKDPRASAVLTDLLQSEAHSCHDAFAELVHCTGGSRLRVGCAMDHLVAGPSVQREGESHPDLARFTVTAGLQPGERLRLVKFVAAGALTAARATGWDGLLAEQRSYLDACWDRADVEVDGDAEIQQAVRLRSSTCCRPAHGARAERSRTPA